MTKKKYVGVKIGAKKSTNQEKTYYYSTDKDYKVGEQIRIQGKNGGTPIAIVAETDAARPSRKVVKKLKEVG